MDPTIKPWIDLWDYVDGNFWGFWQWAAVGLSPAEVGWQPVPRGRLHRLEPPAPR